MIRNKNVLITGASSGIGEALAVYYAQNGAANLFICGRNAERLAKVREACERYGAKVSAEVLDVTQREEVKNWVERCNVSANLNIVIANAGTGTINETEEAVLNTFNTNVNGVINTVLPALAAYRPVITETRRWRLSAQWPVITVCRPVRHTVPAKPV